MQVSNKAQAISPSLTLGINALSSELRAQGKDVVGFGVGEPDFDTPWHIREEGIYSLERKPGIRPSLASWNCGRPRATAMSINMA